MKAITPSKGATRAMEQLEAHGYEAYAVGGCVRDSLLGRSPNDWDLTTSALPDQTLACFENCRTVEIGKQHGTIAVILEGETLEITTYRVDGDYADNRHPLSVTYSRNLSDDLSRRDFTVNAMAYHPARGLVDLFGGREDLVKKVIRAVGDPKRRFEEDGLRILRAIRFASVLGFELEAETDREVHACRHLLTNIAHERIREEFCKLLLGRGAVRILRDYRDVIAVFLPELAPTFDFLQNSKYHCYDVWEHTLHALEQTASDSLDVRLAILLHDVGKPHCYTEDADGGHFKGHADHSVRLSEQLLRRLRFDNATVAKVLTLVRYHDVPIIPETKYVKRAILRFGEEGLFDFLEVFRCDRLAHHPDHCELPEFLSAVPRLVEEIREENACLSLKALAVNGEDLLSLGYRPGRALGETLNALLSAVIDEELPNEREALLAHAEEQLKKQLSGDHHETD